jgi:hypothetical protein
MHGYILVAAAVFIIILCHGNEYSVASTFPVFEHR